jgi:hypothetical protein
VRCCGRPARTRLPAVRAGFEYDAEGPALADVVAGTGEEHPARRAVVRDLGVLGDLALVDVVQCDRGEGPCRTSQAPQPIPVTAASTPMDATAIPAAQAGTIRRSSCFKGGVSPDSGGAVSSRYLVGKCRSGRHACSMIRLASESDSERPAVGWSPWFSVRDECAAPAVVAGRVQWWGSGAGYQRRAAASSAVSAGYCQCRAQVGLRLGLGLLLDDVLASGEPQGSWASSKMSTRGRSMCSPIGAHEGQSEAADPAGHGTRSRRYGGRDAGEAEGEADQDGGEGGPKSQVAGAEEDQHDDSDEAGQGGGVRRCDHTRLTGSQSITPRL